MSATVRGQPRTANRRPGWWVAVLALACAAGACRSAPPAVVLATTTSVANSGLLDRLLPGYERGHDIRVQVLPVGSGRALRMLELEQADVAISHAPALETGFLARHRDWTYRKVLYNDFLIVGPAGDPASIGPAGDVLDALRRVAASGARWVSRGDESGTHQRERELWSAAGAAVPADRLITSGSGMGATLRAASEMSAYTLTDRGTFEQLAPQIASRELYSGDSRLLNTYAVLARGSSGNGRAFADWLAGGEGRETLERLIDSGELKGFNLWPSGAPADRPDAMPVTSGS